jgi:hypothetical protein
MKYNKKNRRRGQPAADFRSYFIFCVLMPRRAILTAILPDKRLNHLGNAYPHFRARRAV